MDVDSEKWRVFALASAFPTSLIYQLEHQRLRRVEGGLTELCGASIVTTDRERARLIAISPDSEEKIRTIRNGVDTTYFSPRTTGPVAPNVVFVGQLDYLPNIDAVLNFYLNILPLIRREVPEVEFKIIGRNPHPAIRKHCGEAYISGEVPDVRPWLESASVFVASFRMAFGVQTKVLEAMAVGVPVVATSQVADGLDALPGRDLLVADNPEEFAKAVIELLRDAEHSAQLSLNARLYVNESHSWEKNVSGLEEILQHAASEIPLLYQRAARSL
jgi:sugar transferase (PEP-CTERM/EpsH1 system associated)